MKQRQKKSLIKALVEFVKLQIAGNILFWGTYIGYAVSDKIFDQPHIAAIAVASLIAHGLFFLASRDWVFDRHGKRKPPRQIWRFVVFMGMNYFINIGIIYTLESRFAITPYIGQFISAFFFTAWNYIGLKFWVFEPENVKHPALTYHKKKKKVSNGRRLTTAKQKAA